MLLQRSEPIKQKKRNRIKMATPVEVRTRNIYDIYLRRGRFHDNNFPWQEPKLTKLLIRHLRETLIPNFVFCDLCLWDTFYEIVDLRTCSNMNKKSTILLRHIWYMHLNLSILNTLSLELLTNSSQTSREVDVKRVYCLMNVWNIDAFERTFGILCF